MTSETPVSQLGKVRVDDHIIDLHAPKIEDVPRLLVALGLNAEAQDAYRDLIHANSLTLMGLVMDRIADYLEKAPALNAAPPDVALLYPSDESAWFNGAAHMISALRLVSESPLLDTFGQDDYHHRTAERRLAEAQAKEDAQRETQADDPLAKRRKITSNLEVSRRV